LGIGIATPDQTRRATNYGLLINNQRAGASLGNTPVFAFIENGGPYAENTTAASYITPPELNAAVWASIIAGARGIIYFNHCFGGPANGSQDNFANAYFRRVQSGQTISIYNQAKATNALVKQLAPVINSPSAVGYVTVNPAAGQFAGFDTMAK